MYKLLDKTVNRIILATICLLSHPFCYGVDLNDPTRPWAYKESTEIVQENQPVLTAILISGNSKTAIIDEKLVKEGDKLGNKLVKSIGRYSVKLIDGEREINLTIFGAQVKDRTK